MTCTEFLKHYTEFRDGLLTAPGEARRFGRHLAECSNCRNYEGTLRRGVQALQTVEVLVPSADFRARLESRLRSEGLVPGPKPSARTGVAAALFIAVAIALLALAGVKRVGVAHAPMLPPVPFPKPVAQAGVPFVTFQDPRASVVISNPNPYGTALVEPAVARR
jgi:predicted anti-sigma-YlaC factor YlaD